MPPILPGVFNKKLVCRVFMPEREYIYLSKIHTT